MVELSKYARKTDSNHLDVKMAIMQAGYPVWDCSGYGQGISDLLVLSKAGDFVFLEVKTPKGRLTKYERKFFDTFENGRRYIVRSPEHAIQVMRSCDNE